MAQDLFASSLNDRRIEYAYGRAIQARDKQNQGFADTGYRAALARDTRLLTALEKMAESTGKLQEQQMGRMMRAPDASHIESRGTTQHQLCREAFRLCDEGKPIRNFEWIYGAAALLCGYNL